jgi:putative folate metabolism gamma-glutamate ligase
LPKSGYFTGEIMNVQAVKTQKIVPGGGSLLEVLDAALPKLTEASIVVITSKIVSICEGSVLPLGNTDKAKLVEQEADYYLPSAASKYNFHFTIRDHTLIPMAGVDESNGADHYILWPKDAQKTVNEVRKYLMQKHGLKSIGIIITDSTSRPLVRGTNGVPLAHSGFKALNNYIGQPDLFGRPYGVTQANVSAGLAAAAVLVMGEGTEQTPLSVISDVPFVQFEDNDPSREELEELTISVEEDLFAPFLAGVEWKKGGHANADT